MSHTATITTQFTAADVTISGMATLTGGSRRSISEPCGGGSTTVALNVDVSALKCFYLTVDADIELTINGPDLELQLSAGDVFSWHHLSNIADPFDATDITSLTVVNGGATFANLQIEVLTDPTP